MKSTLFACNDHKLMMFNENSVKFDGHKSIEFPAGVSSVVVNKNYITVGLSNGVLKVLSNDQNKKVKFSKNGYFERNDNSFFYFFRKFIPKVCRKSTYQIWPGHLLTNENWLFRPAMIKYTY